MFANGGNRFTTTIFVLVSAVQKLTRAIKMAEGTILYRGLGGLMDLPERFHQPDSLGCLGYAEWAFMSTTANRDVAIKYSGVEDGKPKATVLMIRTGAVDRAASLQDYSQYQDEREYLFLPLSFLQPNGAGWIEPTPNGSVSMVSVRVIPNLKTHTIEEVVGKKKSMHIAAFSHLLDELEQLLNHMASQASVQQRFSNDVTKFQGGLFTVEKVIKDIMGECRTVLTTHGAFEAMEYVGDERFRGLVTEMLDTQAMAKSKFLLWLENEAEPICFLEAKRLRQGFREYIGFLNRSVQLKEGDERRVAAEKVCKLKGLVRDAINEVNEIGEYPLLAAAADGAGLEDLKLLIIASGADKVSIHFWFERLPRFD